MGHSSSSVTQNITNNVVNKSDLDVFNKQVNQSIANTVVQNAQQAGGSTSQDQQTTVGNIIAEGKGSKVNLTQEDLQDSQLSVKALQQSIQSVDIGAQMSASITAQLSNQVNTDTLNKLVSQGEASLKSGFGGSIANPFNNTSSTVNTNINNTDITDVKRRLTNIVNNITTNNTDMKSTKDCFSKIVQDYNTKIGNIVALSGAEINIGLSSTQTAKNMAECTQLTQQTTSVTTALAGAMGLKINDDTKTTTETESTATSKAEQETKGLGSVISAIGGVLTGIFGAYTRMIEIIVVVCLLVCCCSSFGLLAMSLIKKKSSTDSDNTTDTTDTANTADTADDADTSS